LQQVTKYPFDGKIEIQVSGSRPAEYALYLRIPAWARPDPLLMVNGQRVSSEIAPGTFASVRRTWKDGDRIELDLPMPLRLEPVDVNHPNLVALMQGSLVLMAVTEEQPAFDEKSLLQARAVQNAAGDWQANAADGSPVTMRPFMSIDKESYSTYVRLKS
jgi:DUF1680 family protein